MRKYIIFPPGYPKTAKVPRSEIGDLTGHLRMFEIDTTICVGCFPVLPAFFKHIGLGRAGAVFEKLKLSRGTTSGISHIKLKDTSTSSSVPNQYSQPQSSTGKGGGGPGFAPVHRLSHSQDASRLDSDLERGRFREDVSGDASDIKLVELAPQPTLSVKSG